MTDIIKDSINIFLIATISSSTRFLHKVIIIKVFVISPSMYKDIIYLTIIAQQRGWSYRRAKVLCNIEILLVLI